MVDTRDTDTMDRELISAELDRVSGGMTKETAVLTAACILCPAFLLGVAAGVAYRTLTA